MPEQLRRLRQLQQTVQLLSQQLDIVRQTIDAEITEREDRIADEEARRRRRRFRVLGLIPFAGLATAVRTKPRVATGVGATVLAGATALAIILGMPTGNHGPDHPPSGTPAPSTSAPPRTARPTPSRPGGPAPSGRPPAAAPSGSGPGRTARVTVVASPASDTVTPLPTPTSSPPPPAAGAPFHCPVDVRRPVTLRACLRS